MDVEEDRSDQEARIVAVCANGHSSTIKRVTARFQFLEINDPHALSDAREKQPQPAGSGWSGMRVGRGRVAIY
jgi:hypothetical protein